MQLIVEISEDTFFDLKKKQNRTEVDNAVLNGTLLPKGHGRLKDENEIKQMIEDAKVEHETSKNFAENIIKFAPTIIGADKTENE